MKNRTAGLLLLIFVLSATSSLCWHGRQVSLVHPQHPSTPTDIDSDRLQQPPNRLKTKTTRQPNPNRSDGLVAKLENRTIKAEVTQEGFFRISLGSDSKNLYSVRKDIFELRQPGEVPRGVFIKVRSKKDRAVQTNRIATDWYTPLIYSSEIVVGIHNDTFQKLDEASISNHIPIQNLLAQLEKSINQAITPEDIEIKIKFDPAVMLIANESNAGSVITYASLETDWLDGSIISR